MNGHCVCGLAQEDHLVKLSAWMHENRSHIATKDINSYVSTVMHARADKIYKQIAKYGRICMDYKRDNLRYVEDKSLGLQ